MTDFNKFNFQFTLKIKPIIENEIRGKKKKRSVDCGWNPFTHMHSCSTKTALQVSSTSGGAKNQ